MIDTVDVAPIDPAWLRHQLSVLLRENLLFNRSVRDNIGLADPAIPLDQLMAAAEFARALEYGIGYPSRMTQSVTSLAPIFPDGQRQCLAIARADHRVTPFRDPPVRSNHRARKAADRRDRQP